MKTAREVAQEVMDIAYDIFGLKREDPSDLLSGPKMVGEAFKLECALRIVAMVEEQKFRVEHPSVHHNTHHYVNMLDQLRETNKMQAILDKEKLEVIPPEPYKPF